MSDWIEWKWTEEKPYPETLETDVQIRMRESNNLLTGSVNEWDWTELKDDSDITYYRLA